MAALRSVWTNSQCHERFSPMPRAIKGQAAMTRMPKYAARADSTQQPIMEAIRKAGWEVYLIRKPVDLLCVKGGRTQLLECKTATGKRNPTAKWRRDQETQNEFCRRTNTPRVTTAEEALRALGDCE